MKTPVVLDQDLVEEIATIGNRRRPNEACGVMIPTPWRGRRVFELPNRSDRPRDSFVMNSEDVLLTLEEWINAQTSPVTWGDLVIWHTHPGGGVGPSRFDMQNRIEQCGNLVVTLPEEGPPVATWF